jgi:hypothetical protein
MAGSQAEVDFLSARNVLGRSRVMGVSGDVGEVNRRTHVAAFEALERLSSSHRTMQ